MVMIDPERIQRLAARLVSRKDALEMVHQMRCGGKKYPGGGKFFRTNLQNESPLMYVPMPPINYPIETPLRFRPQPDLGDYQVPASTGMMVDYPINLPSRTPVVVQDSISAPVVVEVPAENLFSDELVARRALKQRYAESAFNDKAKSKAGAQGAWQIMPITLKDYLGRGRGKAGDLNDPVYNRNVRDWVMGIIPRDLQEFWSEDDSDRAKLAKLYAAYNWGAGNLRGFLRKKQKAGVDISNPDNWVDDLNPETRRYVKYLAFDEDIPDSTVYTNAAFEKAAADRGFAGGGSIHIKPSHRGRLTELKARTGKSEAELYNDGNPAHKKMVVFARNARKWKHGDGGFLDNYYDDGGPYGVIPLGGDYLTYLRTMPEVSGGVIEPSVVTAALPAKFNGSQEAAARYAEGYQKGAKPVSEAISRAGQDIFNTVDTVVGLTPTPAGAITWLGHMGADAAEGEWGKVGRDAALALALGAGARGVGWLKNYVDDATNFGEDIFRAFTDKAPGRVSTNFTNAAPATKTAVEAVPAVTNAVSAPYEIADLGGGYMLKSLMRGNPLEKQIGKNGTINVNNVRALVGKGSKVEQAVVDKVLASEEFAGKKSIDYNKFRKAVQDELITYDRTPDTRWSEYGMGRIGQGMDGSPNARKAVLGAKTHMDRFGAIDVYGTPEERSSVRNLAFDLREGKISESDYDEKFNSIYNTFSDRIVGNSTPETFVFSSSRIPSGSAKHYDPNTLGHSRTYTTADEPDVLHVMESQSDWAQEKPWRRRATLESYSGQNGTDWINEYSPEQADYLVNNYTSRQIQENLRYAAEKGQTKMRYPTKETAAKIEGYPKETNYYDADGNLVTDSRKIYTIGKENEKELDLIQRELDGYYAKFNVAQLPNGDYVPAGNYSDNPYQQLIEAIPRKQAAYDGWRANHPNATSEKGQRVVDDMKRKAEEIKNFRARVKYLNQRMKELKSIKPYVDPSIKKEVKYMHEDDILRKYNEFPKQFKKLYKGADVRTVTDPKGNTWYEVDVPENYLKQEWAYEEGGSMILPKMMMDKHSPDKLRKAIANIKAKRTQ